MLEGLKEFFLTMFLPMLKEKGKDWGVDQLQKIHNKNRKMWKRVLVGGLVAEDIGEDFALKTETKWDDDAVALIGEVIKESATKNNFVLPDLED